MTNIQSALRKLIADSFSLEDLALLCSDIGIDSDSVPGRDKGKEFYLEEIIKYAQRRDLLDVFVKRVNEARPHLRLELSSVDAASIASWLYGEDHLGVDRKLFQVIRERLKDCLDFTREHDFERPFPPLYTDPIHWFLEFCEQPESAFLNPELDRFRLKLRDSGRKLSSYIGQHTFPSLVNPTIAWLMEHDTFDPFKDTVQGVELDPYKDREFLEGLSDLSEAERQDQINERWQRRNKAVKNLNRLAYEFWNAYYAFIQEGRRQLGVA